MRRLSACRKKSVFYKIEQIIYPYKNALWALRLCNRGRLLSVRPAPTMFDHLYASLHKAFGRSISASLPNPQTPFPGKGENTGTGVPATCLGATPQTPFLTTIKVFQQPDSLRICGGCFFILRMIFYTFAGKISIQKVNFLSEEY